ncbi:hypothetical protein [Falsibacillus albus]|uniref:Uncharacterized protein n=1 Tax=Falsibacillus albus TaxID=2478915 RepID=A0A3L7JX13_9BACI|nr:hypothetical protein [Falsibacillus albus]RLQ95418.1 hypothetical protein D9X91_10300 [Falsibacillus albus]
MDYLFELTSDPVVYSFYVSIIFSFTVFKTWRWFIDQPITQDGVRPTVSGSFKSESKTENLKSTVYTPVIMWILKTVKRKERPNDDQDDHLLLLYSY